MSLLRQAQETLKQWRSDSLAVDIVYRRGVAFLNVGLGETEAVVSPTPTVESIKGTQAQTTVTLDDGHTISKSKVSDWLIDVDQMTAFGEPLRGDQIEFDGVRYEVADLGSEHCWRWHGSLRKTYRIHTKQVG
ncbi:MAG: hypothetical protein SFV81_05980 [Pirellulaceae bacterium]|nr:hypothetical protein [Pirellulaceae bacterium]